MCAVPRPPWTLNVVINRRNLLVINGGPARPKLPTIDNPLIDYHDADDSTIKVLLIHVLHLNICVKAETKVCTCNNPFWLDMRKAC